MNRNQHTDALAREYVAGTLHGGARRRFETVMRESPPAAQAVKAWQERLAALAAAVPPVQPSAQLWQGLEQRLFVAKTAAPRRWWQLLSAATVGALLCAVVLRLQPGWITEPPGDLPQSYVGLLTDAEGRPVVLAGSTRHGTQLSIKLLRPLDVPPGQVARLWALPADGRAPFAVGVLPASGKAVVTLPASAEALLSKVPRLGVTFEADASGNAPRGPFVVSGHCVKMW
jgi:anti-sigma-K factor RskA